EHRMRQVRTGFSRALDRVQSCCRTGTKAVELRKDKPHPVGPLVSVSDFGKRLLVDTFLRSNKAGQIVRVTCVGHGSIHSVELPQKEYPAVASNDARSSGLIR